MRGKICFLLAVFLFVSPKAQAFIVINEIHADPAAGISGDANNDGIRSSSGDEFIEVLNFGPQTANISNWIINDSVTTRHIFPVNTFIQPYQYLVVFGGGNPQLPGINWQTASSGNLGLNNSGDTVTLFDINSQIIDQVTYDSLGNNNQSLTRFPEAQGSFVLHSSISQSNGALYSPGASISGEPINNTNVAEPGTMLLTVLGLVGVAFTRCKYFLK